MGGVFNHINGNLYHYAGNNPVKYTDPDGNESFCPLFGFSNPIGELFNFIAQNSSGSDKLVASTVAAANGNAESAYRLEKLSPYMCEAMSKASGEAVIGGMEFMAENGTSLALVAYASGQVEVGTIIDGITVAADVTLAYIDAKNSGDYSIFTKTLIVDIASTAVSVGVSNSIVNDFSKTFNNLQNPLADKAIKSISNLMGEYAGEVTSVTINKIED